MLSMSLRFWFYIMGTLLSVNRSRLEGKKLITSEEADLVDLKKSLFESFYKTSMKATVKLLN